MRVPKIAYDCRFQHMDKKIIISYSLVLTCAGIIKFVKLNLSSILVISISTSTQYSPDQYLPAIGCRSDGGRGLAAHIATLTRTALQLRLELTDLL